MTSFDDALINAEDADISAPCFAMLIAEGTCWKCGQATPMAAIWVPNYTEIYRDEGEQETFDHAALLHYVVRMTASVSGQIAALTPWLRYAYTETSGATYLANHCQKCETVQGDWFVFGADGPFFPQTAAALEMIQYILGEGEFHGCAQPSSSAWMTKVGK
jgi:hypothetical protein